MIQAVFGASLCNLEYIPARFLLEFLDCNGVNGRAVMLTDVWTANAKLRFILGRFGDTEHPVSRCRLQEWPESLAVDRDEMGRKDELQL